MWCAHKALCVRVASSPPVKTVANLQRSFLFRYRNINNEPASDQQSGAGSLLICLYFFDPFSTAQSEDAPNRLDDLVDLEACIDKER